MFAATGAFAKVGKVMVSVAMAIGDPSGATATGAGLEAYLQLHETLSGRHPELAKLSKEIERDLDKALKTPCFHCPKDADRLLPQMIESALPAPQDYADTNLEAEKILALLESKLTDPAHKTPEMLTAFRGLYLPVLQKITNDPRLTGALNPALWRKNLNKQDAILAALENLHTAPRGDLVALAEKFEIPAPQDLRDAVLIEKLTLKAQEYHALKSEIDAIDSQMRGLANMKAAAKDAIERLDFEEVETLLAMVQTAELEVAAETTKLRAKNALMRGKAEQAYRLLSTCADSFGAEDEVLPIHKRLEFQNILYAHALRYGGQGLLMAIQMNRNNLEKTGPDHHPQLWATTQNNLANALQTQGSRTSGAAGKELLAEAVTAYRAALTVRSQQDHPVQWATTQNNLAAALQTQGSRTSGAAGNDLLAEAVTACRAALTVRTQQDHPLDWAMTQNNLAIALQNQGSRTSGAAGNELLAEAVTAYRAALTVYTQQDHPLDWAMTQANLAILYQSQAAHDSCADRQAALRLALEHVDRALTVFDPVHMAYNHTKATELRDEILGALAGQGAG